MNSIKLYEGNCLDVLRKCPDNYMDSIVCDPPYGLSFMSKAWDYQVPSTEIWKECLRVLKPGGHLLAFGGTRTYHRLVVNIEDAGFEIRDQIMWIYGSGFPKSMDISKAIDKEAGAEREVVGSKLGLPGYHLNANEGNGMLGAGVSSNTYETKLAASQITAPSTDEAKRWSGYGTALKPANEPICLARKPLSEKTVAKNVLKHGTGGLNVDASRIPTNGEKLTGGSSNGSQTASEGWDRPWKHDPAAVAAKSEQRKLAEIHAENLGRFPANILFDEYAAGVLDEQTGDLGSGGSKTGSKKSDLHGWTGTDNERIKDTGGASRFFATFKQDTQCDQSDLSTAMPAESSFKHDDARLNSVQEAVRTSCSSDPLLSHCLDSIPDFKKYTLYRDLASLAVSPESIDTTLIMRSLLKLYGSAHLATDENTKSAKSEEKENTEFAQTKFIYQAKASKKDRNQGLEGSGIVNNHATVKPIKLMEYLIKLVTPEGGIVLEPFMGSGTTGVAAQNLGFSFRGIEMDPEYFKIAQARILGAAQETA